MTTMTIKFNLKRAADLIGNDNKYDESKADNAETTKMAVQVDIPNTFFATEGTRTSVANLKFNLIKPQSVLLSLEMEKDIRNFIGDNISSMEDVQTFNFVLLKEQYAVLFSSDDLVLERSEAINYLNKKAEIEALKAQKETFEEAAKIAAGQRAKAKKKKQAAEKALVDYKETDDYKSAEKVKGDPNAAEQADEGERTEGLQIAKANKQAVLKQVADLQREIENTREDYKQQKSLLNQEDQKVENIVKMIEQKEEELAQLKASFSKRQPVTVATHLDPEPEETKREVTATVSVDIPPHHRVINGEITSDYVFDDQTALEVYVEAVNTKLTGRATVEHEQAIIPRGFMQVQYEDNGDVQKPVAIQQRLTVKGGYFKGDSPEWIDVATVSADNDQLRAKLKFELGSVNAVHHFDSCPEKTSFVCALHPNSKTARVGNEYKLTADPLYDFNPQAAWYQTQLGVRYVPNDAGGYDCHVEAFDADTHEFVSKETSNGELHIRNQYVADMKDVEPVYNVRGILTHYHLLCAEAFTPPPANEFLDKEGRERALGELGLEERTIKVGDSEKTIYVRPYRNVIHKVTNSNLGKILGTVFYGKKAADSVAKREDSLHAAKVKVEREAFVKSLVALRAQYEAVNLPHNYVELDDNAQGEADIVYFIKREAIKAKIKAKVQDLFDHYDYHQPEANKLHHLSKEDKRAVVIAIENNVTRSDDYYDTKNTHDAVLQDSAQDLTVGLTKKQANYFNSAFDHRHVDHVLRRKARVRSFMRVMWFLGLVLMATTVTLVVLIVTGVLAAGIFAPLGVLGALATWAAAAWGSTPALLIIPTIGVVVATPIVFMLAGWALGHLYHAVKETSVMRKLAGYFGQSSLAQSMTVLGLVGGIVGAGLILMTVLMSQLGLDIAAVFGVGLVTSLATVFGGNVFAVVLATTLVCAGLIVAGAVAGYVLGMLSKAIFDRVRIPGTQSTDELQAKGQNRWAKTTELGSRFVHWLSKHKLGALAGVGMTAFVVFIVAALTATLAVGLTATVLAAVASIPFWGPVIAITASVALVVIVGALVGAGFSSLAETAADNATTPAPLSADDGVDYALVDDGLSCENTAYDEIVSAKSFDNNRSSTLPIQQNSNDFRLAADDIVEDVNNVVDSAAATPA